jgi:hypothetical protein
MPTKRFFISWITSSISMFLLSYMWHGIFLTDFSRLSYPKGLFLSFAIIVYLILGAIIAKAIDIKLLDYYFRHKPAIRGLIVVGVLGFVCFSISSVVGVSFSNVASLENLLLDVCWQVIEQSVGGMVVGIVHILVLEQGPIHED